MKIKVTKGENSYYSGVDEKYDRNNFKLIQILEDDPYFENFIIKTRKKYNIPLLGFPYTPEGKEKAYNNTSKKDFSKKIEAICEEYGLRREWEKSIFIFLLYNFFPLPKIKPIRIIEEKSLYHHMSYKPFKEVFNLNRKIYIELNYDLGVTELLRLIESNYNKIKSFFKANNYYTLIQIIKISNLNIYKKIYDLRFRQNKKYKEIAEIINDELGRAMFDTDIRVMYLRYKKIIKNLRPKSNN